MTQPTPYVPNTDFSDELTTSEVTGTLGEHLDQEFNAVSVTTAQIRGNMALIQRDDGALGNGTVTPDSLSPATLALISALGGTVRGAWLTATLYAPKDVISHSGATYVGVLTHTSGTFATDLAAGKWILIAGTGAVPTASDISNTPSGGVASSTVQGAINELDGDLTTLAGLKLSKASNLSDVASPSTALGNLGGAPLDSPTFTTKITVPVGTTALPSITGADADSGIGFSADGKTISIGTDNVNIARFKSSKLGLGGIDPTSLLHVKQPSDNAAGGLVIRSTGGQEYAIFISNDNRLFIVNQATGRFIDTDGDTLQNNGNNLPFQQPEYAPADQTITNGGALTLPHGFGIIPKLVALYAVCQSADGNYTGGEVLQLSSGANTSSSDGVQAQIDSTNVTITFGSNSPGFFVLNSNGNRLSIDITKWKLRVRGYA